MSFDVTSPFGSRAAEKLQPWMTDDLGRVLQALGVMVDPILELAEEEGNDGEPGYVPAWGKLLDPTLCPADALPFLGQFVGVEVPKVANVAEARALVKNEPAMERGTLKAIEAAISRALGAETPFTVEERTNAKGEEDAYHFLVVVPSGEGTGALTEAINAVKPGGVFFTIVEVEGAWLAGADTWEAVGAGVTWESVKEGEY